MRGTLIQVSQPISFTSTPRSRSEYQRMWCHTGLAAERLQACWILKLHAGFCMPVSMPHLWDRSSHMVNLSDTGHTAALISRLRPPVTQIVVTSSASQGRRLSALFGAEAFVVSELESVASVMEPAKEAARSLQLLRTGQMVVQVHGRNQPDADADTSCAMQLVSA